VVESYQEIENISARSFAWQDLITFYRYRRQIVSTDSAQILTRGGPTSPVALLSRLNPSLGSYTSISPAVNGSKPIIGHMQYAAGERSAHLAFLMPEDNLNQPELAQLLENIAIQAGTWGAFHLLAEAEENSCAMEGLRKAGFSVYAWQRIWKFSQEEGNKSSSEGNKSSSEGNKSSSEGNKTGSSKNGSNGHNGHGHTGHLRGSPWIPAAGIDENAIRNLYQSLVPPLVQSAEPLTTRRSSGWIYRQDDEILAYVEGLYGPNGIYLQPLIHPAIENVSQLISQLLARLPNRLGRPVYMAVRSYQAWLETVVRDLECQVGPRQALLVKHLVAQQRAAVLVTRHSVLEKYTAEPTAPMVHNSTTTGK
jgi:hypothetical protein